MQFFDTIALGQAVEITGTRQTRNGSLVVNARAARGGNVQDYLGAEVGKPEMAVVRVYRDADEIFHRDSLKTFGHKPVTLNHPAEPVTSRTWKDVARGHTGEDVLRDGEFVRIPMMVSDQAAIDAVNGGHRELSVGYQCDLDWTAGTSPSGQGYDAKQVKIIVDHVAIVDRGRAGPDCRIGDGAPPEPGKTMRALRFDPPTTPQQHKDALPMKTHMIGDNAVEMSDAAIVAVKGLQQQFGTLTADNLRLTADLSTIKAEHATALSAKDAAHAAALKDKDTALATKDAEIDKLKAAQIDDAKLDALATARADIIGKAKAIVSDVKTDGVGIPAIRRAVVLAKLGDAAVKDKSDDYVEARFDLFADEAAKGADPLRRALTDAAAPQRHQGNNVVNLGDAATEYAAMRARDSNAWKMEA